MQRRTVLIRKLRRFITLSAQASPGLFEPGGGSGIDGAGAYGPAFVEAATPLPDGDYLIEEPRFQSCIVDALPIPEILAMGGSRYLVSPSRASDPMVP